MHSSLYDRVLPRAGKNETDKVRGREKDERSKESYIRYAQHASCRKSYAEDGCNA